MWSNDGRMMYVKIVHCVTFILLFMCGFGILYIFEKKITITVFQVWLLLYLFYFSVSVIWGKDAAYASYPIKNLVRCVVVCFLIASVIKDEKNGRWFFADIVIATILANIYIAINITMDNIKQVLFSTSRLGIYGTGKVNANKLAFIYVFTIFFLIYFKSITKKRCLFNLLIIAFIALIILTKSKTAYIMLMYFVGAEYLIYKDCVVGYHKRMLQKFIAVILIAVFLISVFNIPFLYQMIGIRIESAIEMIFGIDNADDSTAIRLHRWSFATDLWISNIKRLLFGIGIGQYRCWHNLIYGSVGWAESHFFQMLAEGGIVGIFIHYSLFFYLVFQYRRIKNSLGPILLGAVFLMELTASEYGDLMGLIYIFAAYLIIKMENENLNCVGYENASGKNYVYKKAVLASDGRI